MTNLRFYPTALPTEQDNSQQDDPVDLLEGSVRSMALRQRINRRTLEEGIIENENTALSFSQIRMPFDKVGQNPTPSKLLGSIGFSIGGQDGYNNNLTWGLPWRRMNGRHIEFFAYRGEYSAPAASELTVGREMPGTAGNKAKFVTVGGLLEAWSGRRFSSCERTTLKDQSTARIAQSLTVQTDGPAGCGIDSKGFYFGSYSTWWHPGVTPPGRRIHRVTYSSEVITRLGINLSTPRHYQSAVGNRYHVLLAGGSERPNLRVYWSSVAIQRFVIGSESLTASAASITESMWTSAKVGNHRHAYLMGGVRSSAWWSTQNVLVMRYGWGTDSISTLGITLARDVTYATAFGSNRNGYCLGGYNGSHGNRAARTGLWPFGTSFIQKLKGMSSGAESISLLGEKLKTPRAEMSSASDYAAGFGS